MCVLVYDIANTLLFWDDGISPISMEYAYQEEEGYVEVNEHQTQTLKRKHIHDNDKMDKKQEYG